MNLKQSQKPQLNSDKTLNKPDYGVEINCQSNITLGECEPTGTGFDESWEKL